MVFAALSELALGLIIKPVTEFHVWKPYTKKLFKPGLFAERDLSGKAFLKISKRLLGNEMRQQKNLQY